MGTRRWVSLFLLAALLLPGAACYGPNQLSRGLDTWGDQLYVDSPWVAQVAHFSGVFTVGWVAASFLDYVLLNPFDFWGIAVPTGNGTPYVYRQPMRPTNPIRP